MRRDWSLQQSTRAASIGTRVTEHVAARRPECNSGFPVRRALVNGTPSCTRATAPSDAVGRLTWWRSIADGKDTSLRDDPSATQGSP